MEHGVKAQQRSNRMKSTRSNNWTRNELIFNARREEIEMMARYACNRIENDSVNRHNAKQECPTVYLIVKWMWSIQRLLSVRVPVHVRSYLFHYISFAQQFSDIFSVVVRCEYCCEFFWFHPHSLRLLVFFVLFVVRFDDVRWAARRHSESKRNGTFVRHAVHFDGYVN